MSRPCRPFTSQGAIQYFLSRCSCMPTLLFLLSDLHMTESIVVALACLHLSPYSLICTWQQCIVSRLAFPLLQGSGFILSMFPLRLGHPPLQANGFHSWHLAPPCGQEPSPSPNLLVLGSLVSVGPVFPVKALQAQAGIHAIMVM